MTEYKPGLSQDVKNLLDLSARYTSAKNEYQTELRDEAKKLVIFYRSYTKAAKAMGVTKQHIHQLARPGLATSYQDGSCSICGRSMRLLQSNDKPKCKRCWQYKQRTGVEWSAERVATTLKGRRRRKAAYEDYD